MSAPPTPAPISSVDEALMVYVLRQADRAMVLSHRLSEWIAHAPEIEEDVALANLALDLLGQARVLYGYAAEVEGRGRTEDDLAFERSDREYRNVLLVEQPNGDFAHTMIRQLLHDAYAIELWSALRSSGDTALAALADKAVKETAYHLRHAATWVVRLGEGTDESRRRTIAAAEAMWPFVEELFEVDDIDRVLVEAAIAADPLALRAGWDRRIDAVLAEIDVPRPEVAYPATGGRHGRHGEGLSYVIAEMRSVRVDHPGAVW